MGSDPYSAEWHSSALVEDPPREQARYARRDLRSRLYVKVVLTSLHENPNLGSNGY